MISLTSLPPLWRKMMDHRVIEHYNGDLTRVNIHPRVRDKGLAKYGVRPARAATACPGLPTTSTMKTKGASREGFPAGTAWTDIPEDCCRPYCAGAREGRL